MSVQVPGVGRIVHYHWPDKMEQAPDDPTRLVTVAQRGFAAAIITCVYPDQSCDLKVFFGPFHDGLLGDERHAVKQEPNRFGVYWGWPPRV